MCLAEAWCLGSLILLAGEPGIGKSTLVMDMAAQLSQSLGEALYVSGEESAAQIKLRAARLGLTTPDLYILTETNLGAILDAIDARQPSSRSSTRSRRQPPTSSKPRPAWWRRCANAP